MSYPSEWLKKSPVSALPSISALSCVQNWSACANVADKPDEEPYITSTPPASITTSTTGPTPSNGHSNSQVILAISVEVTCCE